MGIMNEFGRRFENECELRWYCPVFLLRSVLFLRLFGLILSLCFDANFSEVQNKSKTKNSRKVSLDLVDH